MLLRGLFEVSVFPRDQVCQHSIRNTDLLHSQQGSRLSTVRGPKKTPLLLWVMMHSFAGLSWPRSVPRIGSIVRRDNKAGLKIQS